MEIWLIIVVLSALVAGSGGGGGGIALTILRQHMKEQLEYYKEIAETGDMSKLPGGWRLGLFVGDTNEGENK